MVWVWLKIKHTIKRVNRPGRQKLWVHWCLMLEPSPIVDPCRGGEKDEVPGVWQTDDWGTCSLLASGHYQQDVSGRTQQYGHENPDFAPFCFHMKTAACSGCSSPVHLPLYCFLAYYINQNPCGAVAPHSSTTITSDPFSTLSLSQMWGQEFSITP